MMSLRWATRERSSSTTGRRGRRSGSDRSCAMKRGALIGFSLVFVGCPPLLGQQPSEPSAHHTDASVDFRVATTGFGGEVAKLLTGHVAARVGGSFFSVSTTKS